MALLDFLCYCRIYIEIFYFCNFCDVESEPGVATVDNKVPFVVAEDDADNAKPCSLCAWAAWSCATCSA